MQITRARLLAVFFAVTFAIGWLPPLFFAVRGIAFGPGISRALTVFMAFAPLIGALVVQGPMLKGEVMKPLGLTTDWNRFWIVAWLAPVLILFVGVLATWLGTGLAPVLDTATLLANKRSLVAPADLAAFDAHVRAEPPSHPLVLVLLGLPAGLTINLFPSLAEEIGWRGLLFREMPGGFLARSLAIGLVVGVFWLPLAFFGGLYPENPTLGAGLFLAVHLALAPSMTYFRLRGTSVIPVAIFRGTYLAMTRVAYDLCFGSSSLVRPMYGIAAVVGALVLFGALAAYDRFVAETRVLGTRPSAA
ncbi:MAG: hypothetical protein U0230_13430 [Polyangiales bacterium]